MTLYIKQPIPLGKYTGVVENAPDGYYVEIPIAQNSRPLRDAFGDNYPAKVTEIYGYASHGMWPFAKSLEDLERLVNAVKAVFEKPDYSKLARGTKARQRDGGIASFVAFRPDKPVDAQIEWTAGDGNHTTSIHGEFLIGREDELDIVGLDESAPAEPAKPGFKVGDKVRMLSWDKIRSHPSGVYSDDTKRKTFASTYTTQREAEELCGKTLVVMRVSNFGGGVCVEGHMALLPDEALELVPVLKVGDKVRLKPIEELKKLPASTPGGIFGISWSTIATYIDTYTVGHAGDTLRLTEDARDFCFGPEAFVLASTALRVGDRVRLRPWDDLARENRLERGSAYGISETSYREHSGTYTILGLDLRGTTTARFAGAVSLEWPIWALELVPVNPAKAELARLIAELKRVHASL